MVLRTGRRIACPPTVHPDGNRFATDSWESYSRRGLGALAIARTNDIGMVLLDLSLADEDGLEILPRLRENPSFAGVPIVAFTAHDSRRHEAMECGVDHFVCRPFSAADLRALVEDYLSD
jgi:putative two-component system response regulator